MKETILLLMFFLLLFSCKKNQQVLTETNTQKDFPKTMYVNATEGLRVRNSPSSDGEKIGLLKHNTQVIITNEDINTVNIEGINGKWVYITTPIEGWVFDGFLDNSISQEKYSLKSIYDISGGYHKYKSDSRWDYDLMIDYGSKMLFVPTYWVLDMFDIDTLELINNNVYKMTFNGLEHTKQEVPNYLIIEILERNEIKIEYVIERLERYQHDYSDELNGVFYKKTDINFNPTHIIIGVERPSNHDEHLDDISLREYPDIKSKEVGLRGLIIGAVVQLIEIGSTETINEITADWYKVRANAGTEGWIFSAYLDKFNETVTQNEIKKPLENPDRQKIIGKWRNEDHFGKEWNFYEDGTFDFSLIAHSMVGKWIYESNKIFIKEPLDIIFEETESHVKRNGFWIDVEIIDDNNMIFFNSKYISEHFGFGYQDGKYIELKK